MPVSAFVEIRGTRIHYLDWRNDGPPILIIHGNTHAGGVYSPLAARLNDRFRVVAVDLRGHGLSDEPGDYSWAAMQQDIVGLVEHLDLRDLLIAAHSRGGGVAILAAAALESRMRGMVVFEPTLPLQLIEPGVSPDKVLAWAAKRQAQSAHRRSTFPSRDTAYAHYFGRGGYKNWVDEYLRAFIEHALVDTDSGTCELASSLEVEAQLVRARLGMDGWADLRPSPLPLLALFGEDSGRLGGPADPLTAIRRLFPRMNAQMMPRTTHSAPMERPDLFEASIREFAAGIAPAV